ncbi:MAG: bifunctional precorrin-2 dehydrogenase/sirohydrochlorin ferrochelatase [Spirochaetes bacterium]|nr:bifunctional precorrin-2 dehydrogenase/sirohydrochlorin ferrochelatase [Spirochaetota bacterium]
MKLYPVMINIEGKKAVVIGGGSVALRKVKDLLECGAFVRIIAPEIHDEIARLSESYSGRIDIVRRIYRNGDCEGSLIVFSATNDETVNRNVYEEASSKNILINAVDDPPNCSFFMPSWFNRNGLIVAVSTSGISPSMSARIRRDIERSLPVSVDEGLAALQQARLIIREDEDFSTLSSERRGTILKHIVQNDNLLGDLVNSYKNDSVKMFLLKLKTDLT